MSVDISRGVERMLRDGERQPLNQIRPGLYTRREIYAEIDRLFGLLAEMEKQDDPKARRRSAWFLVVALFVIAAALWALWQARFESTAPRITPRELRGVREDSLAAVSPEHHLPGKERTMAKGDLGKALSRAFDAHEKHRETLVSARQAHKDAREADDRVRHIRRLERERQGARSRRGRAA